MVRSIETFKRVKDQMVILGYSPFQNLPRWCQSIPVNSIYIGLISIILILFVWTTSWFLIFEEKTFDELAESVFFTVQSILYITLYPMLYWTKDRLMIIFEELDEIIEKRKHSTYKYN